eukprot:1372819-Rhodomonas_salina.1
MSQKSRKSTTHASETVVRILYVGKSAANGVCASLLCMRACEMLKPNTKITCVEPSSCTYAKTQLKKNTFKQVSTNMRMSSTIQQITKLTPHRNA